jgi:hypothetical protein
MSDCERAIVEPQHGFGYLRSMKRVDQIAIVTSQQIALKPRDGTAAVAKWHRLWKFSGFDEFTDLRTTQPDELRQFAEAKNSIEAIGFRHVSLR